MMQELGLDTAQAEAEADTLRAMGKTAMFIAVDGALCGIVAVADPIKGSTAQKSPQKERLIFLKLPARLGFSTACQCHRPDSCII